MAVVRFLVRGFALIGLLVVLASLALTVWIFEASRRGPDLPQAIVLEIDLTRPIADAPPSDPFAGLFGRRTTSLEELRDALDRARSDARVKGVFVRFGPEEPGLAQAQELRDAIARLRAAGRFAIAHADSFGEVAGGMRSYYLATACDEIWMQPVGMVGITGVATAVPFLRDFLALVGLEPEYERRKDYKTFGNTFTERGFTPAHLEMQRALVDDLMRQLVGGIAQGRGLTPEAVRALVDRAPLLEQEALDGRLVDRLGGREEAELAARRRGGEGARLVSVADYLDAAPEPMGTTVALIHGTGPIQRGESDLGGLLDEQVMGADTLAAAFADVVADPEVKAIVFRIDSPGGSAVASETIRRAVVRARAAGKPVIVSMGDAAASGGYWVAMDADHIVAQPATLTGSIGVVAGKFVATDLLDRLGIAVGSVSAGQNAGFLDPTRGFSETERARLDAFLDATYAAFVGKVAAARSMAPEVVEAVAQGRVWTGAQAKERGLVDELGGLHEALVAARRAMGLAEDAPLRLVSHPRRRGPLERALELMGMTEAGARLRAQAEAIRAARTALAPLAPLLRAPGEAVARMPDLGF